MKTNTTTRHGKTRRVWAASAAMAMGLAQPTMAATFLWDGGAGTGVWQNSTDVNNWNPNVYAPGNGADPSDSYVFNNTGTQTATITLQGGHNPNIQNIAIDTSTSRTFQIDGAVGSTRLELFPEVQNDESLTVSSGTHVINGINTTASSGIVRLGTVTLQDWHISGAAQLTINAAIDGTGPDRGFTKRGAGTLVLTNAASTFGGTVIAADGDLRFSSIANAGAASALGSGSQLGSRIQLSIDTLTGGALTYTGADASTNRQVFLQRRSDGSGGSGTLTSTANDLTLTGGVSVDTAGASGAGVYGLSMGGAGDILVNSTGISGAAALTKIGAGTVTLNAANTYTGETDINAGVLRLGHADALGSTVEGTTIAGGNTTDTSRVELIGGLAYAAETLTLNGRIIGNNPTAHVQNVSGDNTWQGDILFAAGGSRYIIESAADHLLITGDVTNSTSTGRALRLNGAADGEISGVISHTAPTVANFTAVEKQGAGTWTLSGDNTYTGATNVQEGTLLVNGAHTGGGLYTVSSGATLGGTGSINADLIVNAGGFLAPGNSIESLAVDGDVTLNGTLDVEVGGTQIDLLAITGLFDITSAILDFDQTAALTANVYVLATYGSLSGSQFASVLDLPTGYVVYYGYEGNQIVLINATHIPAPAALPAGLGLLTLAATRRRRAAR